VAKRAIVGLAKARRHSAVAVAGDGHTPPVNVSGPQWERRPPARHDEQHAVPEAGAPKHGFALTTALPCDTLRAWQNLHWGEVSARCWAAIRF